MHLCIKGDKQNLHSFVLSPDSACKSISAGKWRLCFSKCDLFSSLLEHTSTLRHGLDCGMSLWLSARLDPRARRASSHPRTSAPGLDAPGKPSGLRWVGVARAWGGPAAYGGNLWNSCITVYQQYIFQLQTFQSYKLENIKWTAEDNLDTLKNPSQGLKQTRTSSLAGGV